MTKERKGDPPQAERPAGQSAKPQQAAKPPEDDRPFIELEAKALLDHADKAWKAAEENSRRLALRVNLLLTTLVALLAATAAKLATTNFVEIESPWADRTAWVCGELSMLFFCLALVDFLGANKLRRRKRAIAEGSEATMFASDAFARIHQRATEGEVELGTRNLEVCIGSFWDTMDAAIDLQARNAFERRRIDGAQQYYLLGLLCAALSVIVYTTSVHRQAAADRSVMHKESLNEQREPQGTQLPTEVLLQGLQDSDGAGAKQGERRTP